MGVLAVPEVDRALDNRQKVLDHSRKIGLLVAFIFACSMGQPFSIVQCRWSAGLRVSNPIARNGIPDRAVACCWQGPFTALPNRTVDWIASTLPRKLGNGSNAGG